MKGILFLALAGASAASPAKNVLSENYETYRKKFSGDLTDTQIMSQIGELPNSHIWQRNAKFISEFQHSRVQVGETSKSGLESESSGLPLVQSSVSYYPGSIDLSKLALKDDETTKERHEKYSKALQKKGYRVVHRRKTTSKINLFDTSSIDTPSFWNETQFDWRNVVTLPPVKHQKKNECYAETAAVVLDALYQIKYPSSDEDSTVQFFSPDDMMACSGHTFGETGLPDQVFSVNADFSPKDGCHGTDNAMRLADTPIVFCDLYGDRDIELKLMDLLKIAPVSVGIESHNPVFRNYKSGVLSPYHIRTPRGMVDHAVTIVGFGEDETNANFPYYWTIRNSWGENWGEKGYARIQRFSNASMPRKGVFNAYAAVVNAI